MQSAGSLLEASKELTSHPRSAAMLRRHALEEVAKILILIDLVRCPISQRPSRVGRMTKWFYDHLARLIYVEAQSWKPTHARQLQEYIDGHRRTHYLEGAVGEYIMPNFEVYRRESDMYADIEGEEDGTLHWSDPQSTYRDSDVNDFSQEGIQILGLGRFARLCKNLEHSPAKVSMRFHRRGNKSIFVKKKTTRMQRTSPMKWHVRWKRLA